MNKCNNCWMEEFKNTKHRLMGCSVCELNYHWLKLLDATYETWLVRLFRRKNRKDIK